ncbi:hypothetical protein EIP91_002440 [Steccherinum ochraceum]|uniref:C2H2-type domain-containing protein n=1 Tax=Steccherinum ochraceum TaxID=92696 RepID=A0A4R0RIK1_9APHY|nr:hypothetical protein EIP91_002440 [Steccherinum ochraceum]
MEKSLEDHVEMSHTTPSREYGPSTPLVAAPQARGAVRKLMYCCICEERLLHWEARPDLFICGACGPLAGSDELRPQERRTVAPLEPADTRSGDREESLPGSKICKCNLCCKPSLWIKPSAEPTCAVCQAFFEEHTELLQHSIAKHPYLHKTTEPVGCSACDSTFVDSVALSQHTFAKHSNVSGDGADDIDALDWTADDYGLDSDNGCDGYDSAWGDPPATLREVPGGRTTASCLQSSNKPSFLQASDVPVSGGASSVRTYATAHLLATSSSVSSVTNVISSTRSLSGMVESTNHTVAVDKQELSASVAQKTHPLRGNPDIARRDSDVSLQSGPSHDDIATPTRSRSPDHSGLLQASNHDELQEHNSSTTRSLSAHSTGASTPKTSNQDASSARMLICGICTLAPAGAMISMCGHLFCKE